MSSGDGAGAPAAAAPSAAAAAPAGSLDAAGSWSEAEAALPAEVAGLSAEQIRQRTTMLTNNMRVLQVSAYSVLRLRARLRAATQRACMHAHRAAARALAPRRRRSGRWTRARRTPRRA